MTSSISSAVRGLVIAVVLGGCKEPDVVEHRTESTELEEDEAELTKLAFDPATVETVHGTVVAVEPFQRMGGTRYGLRLRLAAEGDEIFYVYLGPQGYIEHRGLVLGKDDAIEVTGSVVSGDGRRVVIANEIVKGTTAVKLRDEAGRPLWRRWRHPARR